MTHGWLAPLRQLAERIETRTLSNGLTAIVWPIPDVNVVGLQVWVRAGSAADPNGQDGAAHFLEHMMFRGSPAYGDGMFDNIVESRGIESNAMTWYDFTAYTHLTDYRNLPLLMDLEVDRMRAPDIDPEVVEEERAIILNERASHIDSDPDERIEERLHQMGAANHPYSRPVIGRQAAIRDMSGSALRKFHAENYTAGNMAVLVVGDVVPDEVFAMVNAHFGVDALLRAPTTSDSAPGLDRGPSSSTNTSPAPTLRRSADTFDDIQRPRVYLSFASPGYADSEGSVCLDLMSEILDGSIDPLLEDIFERGKPSCSETSFFATSHRHGSLGFIRLVTESPEDAEQLAEQAINILLARIRAISSHVFKAASERLALQQLARMDSADFLAEQTAIGWLYADDPRAEWDANVRARESLILERFIERSVQMLSASTAHVFTPSGRSS